jgi:uncharacterized phiE125 gp8 family phage protein
MNRVTLTPTVLPSSALAELKQWLGITTTRDDLVLTGLLTAAVEMCEAYTGLMPIATDCEEILAVCSGWQSLSTRPVQAIVAADAIAEDGVRIALPTSDYEIELDADGTGRIRVLRSAAARRIVVRFTAGLAESWTTLAEPLRHGVLRLAAHQHRERETAGAGALPPASVAALWRPWRRLRLV